MKLCPSSGSFNIKGLTMDKGEVTSMPSFLEKFFPTVYKYQEQNVAGTDQFCRFFSFELAMFISLLYVASFLASIAASNLTRVFGRRPSMLIGGTLFLAGAVSNVFAATDVTILLIGRVLLGFGVGFANQSAPLYLSEMAPCKHCGALNSCFQLCISIGILAAHHVNYAVKSHKNGWRISIGLAAVPALIFITGSLFLPETPHSLIERGRPEEARRILRTMRGIHDVDDEFKDLAAVGVESKNVKDPWINLMQRKYYPQLVFAVVIPYLNQISGMNLIMLYSPVIFKIIRLRNTSTSWLSYMSRAANFVFTILSMKSVDKVGRRWMFIQGGIQMFISLIIMISIVWKYGVDGNPIILFVTIFSYVGGFALSWGPLGWLVPSKILPLEIRSQGHSDNLCINMFCEFFFVQLFTDVLCSFKFLLFLLLPCSVLFMTLFRRPTSSGDQGRSSREDG
ncbi:sugar transport protein 1-like [Henckelia pumila]|uniref:sugar transport protein 1-like n=1 Tax=Henckelia pumila TaxID=405737 RepID=UPI003C6E5ADC